MRESLPTCDSKQYNLKYNMYMHLPVMFVRFGNALHYTFARGVFLGVGLVALVVPLLGDVQNCSEGDTVTHDSD